MKLTLQLQLVPTPDQHIALLDTLRAFNAAATYAARVGVDAKRYSQQTIHRLCYRELRDRFGLSSQMAVRAIAKAVECFRRSRAVCPVFKDTGAMTYDERLLGWKGPAHVSLLTLQGRTVVAMVYGEYQAGLLPRLKGQVDLVYRKRTFYLYATIELPENPPIQAKRFLGVDLGIEVGAHGLTEFTDRSRLSSRLVGFEAPGEEAVLDGWVIERADFFVMGEG